MLNSSHPAHTNSLAELNGSADVVISTILPKAKQCSLAAYGIDFKNLLQACIRHSQRNNERDHIKVVISSKSRHTINWNCVRNV